MAAGHFTYAPAKLPRLGWAVVAAWVITAAVFVGAHAVVERRQWASEVLLGSAIAALLVWLGRRSLIGTSSWLHRALEARLLVWLGLFSYSLYLIHSPFLGLGNLLMRDVAMSTATRFAIELLVIAPISIALAYGFHRLVERRFMTSHQRTVRSEVEPAPAGT